MAVTRELFSITAAHGLTDRAAITWHPSLPRTPRVMVPIHLDALVQRQDGGQWADTRMSPPSGIGDPVPRLSLLPDPFTELPAADVASLRKRGVHLHWALPDGLTRGTTQDATKPATFQPIPDRWLVVRMSPARDGSPRRAVRGWVLVAGGDQPQVHDLIGFTEPGPSQGSKGALTAMGHGDPAWAAYYDNVLDRLSFFDDLSDIKLGPIAYMVCGWYSDPLLDPLGTNINSLSAFDARMAQLGWEARHRRTRRVLQQLQLPRAGRQRPRPPCARNLPRASHHAITQPPPSRHFSKPAKCRRLIASRT